MDSISKDLDKRLYKFVECLSVKKAQSLRDVFHLQKVCHRKTKTFCERDRRVSDGNGALQARHYVDECIQREYSCESTSEWTLRMSVSCLVIFKFPVDQIILIKLIWQCFSLDLSAKDMDEIVLFEFEDQKCFQTNETWLF